MHKVLENGNLQVTIPILFRSLNARQKIIFPGELPDNEPLAVALARAFRWQRYIDEGKVKNIRELAKKLGLDESHVGKIMRLRFLSPALVHRIVSGDIPRSLTLKSLREAIPDIWTEQEVKWIGCEALSWREG